MNDDDDEPAQRELPSVQQGELPSVQQGGELPSVQQGESGLVRPIERSGSVLAKATEVVLAKRVEQVAAAQLKANLSAKVHNINETRTTADMTLRHANALIEVARARYVVPEEQRTLRSKQQTQRQMITGGVIIIVGVLAALVPESAKALAAMILVLGGGLVFSEYFNRDKRPELPQSDTDDQLKLPKGGES